jgi:hypothetical protein
VPELLGRSSRARFSWFIRQGGPRANLNGQLNLQRVLLCGQSCAAAVEAPLKMTWSFEATLAAERRCYCRRQIRLGKDFVKRDGY